MLALLRKFFGLKAVISGSDLRAAEAAIQAAENVTPAATLSAANTATVRKGMAAARKLGASGNEAAAGKSAYETIHKLHIDTTGQTTAGAVAAAFEAASVGGVLGRLAGSPAGIASIFAWIWGTHVQDITSALGLRGFADIPVLNLIPGLRDVKFGAKNDAALSEFDAKRDEFHADPAAQGKAMQLAAIDKEIASIKATLGAPAIAFTEAGGTNFGYNGSGARIYKTSGASGLGEVVTSADNATVAKSSNLSGVKGPGQNFAQPVFSS